MCRFNFRFYIRTVERFTTGVKILSFHYYHNTLIHNVMTALCIGNLGAQLYFILYNIIFVLINIFFLSNSRPTYNS